MSYSFYAALFWDADCTQRASEVLELKLEKTYVTTGVFKGLTAGTYYLAETDAEGNALDLSDPGAVFTNEITEEVITLTPKQASQSTEITNHLLNPPEGNLYEDDGAIEIDKSVAAGEKAKAVTDTFYFTLYSDEEMTHVVETKSLSLKEASAGKVVFDALAYGTYYIAETDAEGNPVDDSFGYDVTVSDEEIKLEDGNTVTVKIVNDLGDEETPDKKPKSDSKDNTSIKKSNSPQTGDNSQTMLYLILLLGAAMIVAGVMIMRKRIKK